MGISIKIPSVILLYFLFQFTKRFLVFETVFYIKNIKSAKDLTVMFFILYTVRILATMHRIKVLSKDRDFEMSVHSTGSYTNDIVLVPSTNDFVKENTFVYEESRGGLRTMSGRFITKGVMTSDLKYSIKLENSKSSSDGWKISPRTDYNTISNSESYCFKKGKFNKSGNYYELFIESCNITDPEQQFLVIDLERTLNGEDWDINQKGEVDILNEPMYLGK